MNGSVTAKAIESRFEFGSNYSDLSVMRIEELAARLDVRIRWRPFLLGPIFRTFDWDTSPFVLQQAKGDYVWKDMVRQCGKYHLAWSRPSTFPRTALLPLRVALVGAEQDWIVAAGRGVFGAPMFFVGDDMFWGNDRLDDALAHCIQERA